MKYIKLFENFISHSDIDRICNYYNITNYTINDDYSIDVEADVNLSYKKLDKLPLKFNIINGAFICSHNNLTSLENSPRIVKKLFSCSNNKLNNIEDGPLEAKSYYCDNNNLTSLKGLPTKLDTLSIQKNHNLNSLEHIGSIKLGLNLEYTKIYSFDFLSDAQYIIFNDALESLLRLFNKNRNLIDAFNDYNIIKAPKNTDDKPRLKVSNLNSFLTDNGFEEVEDTSELEKYYDLK